MSPDFYLSSTEGYGLETPRACFRIKRLKGRSYDDYLLVKIDPPIFGQAYGLGAEDIDYVVLAVRYVKTSLFPISEWPLYVHVARLLCDTDIADKTSLEEKDIELIGWGEINQTPN